MLQAPAADFANEALLQQFDLSSEKFNRRTSSAAKLRGRIDQAKKSSMNEGRSVR
jgi:hypothetical protein